MIGSAMSATAVALALYLAGHLQIRRLYVASAMQGVSSAFQWPASRSVFKGPVTLSAYTSFFDQRPWTLQ
jgi:hypothetical protein